MAISQIVNSNGITGFVFEGLFGGGWEDDIFTIIARHIQPEKIERKLNKAGWHSSDREIVFVKNSCEYIVHFDEMDQVCIFSNDTQCHINVLESLAIKIDTEIQQLHKGRK